MQQPLLYRRIVVIKKLVSSQMIIVLSLSLYTHWRRAIGQQETEQCLCLYLLQVIQSVCYLICTPSHLRSCCLVQIFSLSSHFVFSSHWISKQIFLFVSRDNVTLWQCGSHKSEGREVWRESTDAAFHVTRNVDVTK